MSGSLEDLNPKQRRAAEAGDGPLMIMAGPGTGKTKTLVARIAYLIESGKAKAGQILALTFTKKAAEEMQGRLSSLLPELKPHIATFHALCHQILGGDEAFVSEVERLAVIKSLPRPKSLKGVSLRELGLMISRAKNQLEVEDPDLARLVKSYNRALAERQLMDFDDLLIRTYELLKGDKTLRTTIQERYRYVLVDEFQDTNRLQYEILKLLLGHNNIFVIGDPNQSIYGFRGATADVFQEFKRDFPQSGQITLTTNYRSAPDIVRLANAIFGEAPDLVPGNQTAGRARAVEVLNEYGEAEWVLSQIHRAIGGGDFLRAISDDVRSQHRRLSDFAVLYRSRSAAAIFQKLLAESGLPYQVVGDGSPYDRPDIQAIIALLKAGLQQQALQLEGYGSAQKRLLEQELATADQAIPSVLVEKIIEILGFEPSHELQQLAGTLVKFKDVKAALQYFDDIAEQGFYDPAADAITLLTTHAAKGLEFPQVFLIGTEEGILPSTRGDEAEEKRLFYVAVTRAQERLEIIHARNRGGQKTEISRFVKDLPSDALEHHTDPEMTNQVRRIAKRTAKRSQQSLF